MLENPQGILQNLQEHMRIPQKLTETEMQALLVVQENATDHGHQVRTIENQKITGTWSTSGLGEIASARFNVCY